MPNPAPLVHIESAGSHCGRAKCKVCLKVIPQDQPRVSLPMFSVGRIVDACFHPKCLVTKGISVDNAKKNSAGKCKVSGAALNKGDFRLLVKADNAHFCLGLKPAMEMFDPILTKEGLNGADIKGADTLDEEHPATKKWRMCGSSGYSGIVEKIRKVTAGKQSMKKASSPKTPKTVKKTIPAKKN